MILFPSEMTGERLLELGVNLLLNPSSHVFFNYYFKVYY